MPLALLLPDLRLRDPPPLPMPDLTTMPNTLRTDCRRSRVRVACPTFDVRRDKDSQIIQAFFLKFTLTSTISPFFPSGCQCQGAHANSNSDSISVSDRAETSAEREMAARLIDGTRHWAMGHR